MKIKHETKSMAMFEMNDEKRQHEFEADSSYVEHIAAFLKSLGFEVEFTEGYKGGDLKVNGVKIGVDLDSASYMGKSAYGKQSNPRKERFVAISGMGQTIRIPINKETESDKLKKRINDIIELSKKRHQENIEYEYESNRVPRKLFNYLTKHPILNPSVIGIQIYREGRDTPPIFTISTEFGAIEMDMDNWTFKRFSANNDCFLVSTVEELRTITARAQIVSSKTLANIQYIAEHGHNLSKEEIDLLKKCYNMSVDSKFETKELKAYAAKIFPDYIQLARDIGYMDKSNPELNYDDIEYCEKKGEIQFAVKIYSVISQMEKYKKQLEKHAFSL